MATECPRTVTTHREIALPPEIVALVFSFKPREMHSPEPWRVSAQFKGCLSPGRPYYWNYPNRRVNYHCCGGAQLPCPGPYGFCTRFATGMYHPGRLRENIYPFRYLRWTCCGATFGYRGTLVDMPVDSPVGCTPIDLTLRVTTVTRAAPPTDPETEQAA